MTPGRSATLSSDDPATSTVYRVTILLAIIPTGADGGATFGRWVVLSDHEQRVLAELERCFETDVGEPARSVPAGSVPASRGHARLTSRRPGTWPTIVQGF